MEPILTTIKRQLGVPELDDGFDMNILTYINMTLSLISQFGLSIVDKLPIIDSNDTWIDLLEDRTDLEYLKTYIYLKVKMIFDPPTSSAAISAINESIKEYEWRIANHERNKGVISNGSTTNRRLP